MRACIKGCQGSEGPSEATRGLICERCYQGIEESLPETAQVLSYLREIYAMQVKGDDDGSQKLRKDPPAPLNLHALDLTHQIFWALFESMPRSSWEPWDYLEIAGDEANRLLQHLPDIANSNQIRSLLALEKLLKHAKASFPMQEKKRVTALPCPNCNKRTIYTPPQAYQDNLEVVCFDCGFRIPPEKMEFYANLAEKEAENAR
jgi:predicted RNA-binding Zn-ribbon protein involved in translation (DUF1610 family)